MGQSKGYFEQDQKEERRANQTNVQTRRTTTAGKEAKEWEQKVKVKQETERRQKEKQENEKKIQERLLINKIASLEKQKSEVEKAFRELKQEQNISPRGKPSTSIVQKGNIFQTPITRNIPNVRFQKKVPLSSTAKAADITMLANVVGKVMTQLWQKFAVTERPGKDKECKNASLFS